MMRINNTGTTDMATATPALYLSEAIAYSYAKIEKSRVAVTDSSGRYRLVELLPGSYAVTFTLTGFSAVRREGIQLSGSLNATVDAELRVGSLEETITVTGESPIVDVQSVRQQRVIDREVIDSIPGARMYHTGSGGCVMRAGTNTLPTDTHSPRPRPLRHSLCTSSSSLSERVN